MKLTIDGRSYEVELRPDATVVDGASFKTRVVHDDGTAMVRVNGRPFKVQVNDDKKVVVDGRSFGVEVSGRAAVARQAPKAPMSAPGGAEKGAVAALMPGTVLSLRVHEGDRVAAGAVLLIVEAMKMQNEIKAPHAGTVKRILVAPGQTLSCGDVMVVIDQ
jgi:biotin carboxyl carrier protein